VLTNFRQLFAELIELLLQRRFLSLGLRHLVADFSNLRVAPSTHDNTGCFARRDVRTLGIGRVT